MLFKLYAIPEELRLLPNWCLWKYEWPNGKDKKPTKVPYQLNGYKCDVTNPSNWVKFDEAFNCLQLGSYDGLGFIFTNTGYAGIDLDDTSLLSNGEPNPNAVKDYEQQLNIFKEFDSYSECSPSGKGLHIIVKGSVPQGRRRAFVEIYSSGRYFTMTGNVYNNKPIEDRQFLLQSLYEQMAAPAKISTYTGNEPETQNDKEITSQAESASNGDKFKSLYSGDWQSYYSSQSEADFAIIDIIAFYTQNRNQIARIFRASALGARDKAKRSDYVNNMIQRSFDRMPPPINTDDFREALEAKLRNRNENNNSNISDCNSNSNGVCSGEVLAGSVNGKPTPFDGVTVGSNPTPAANNGSVAQRLVPVAHNGSDVGSNPATSTITPPPGLLGEIARFIYSAAPRPVPEIAIAAAIGLMAGICGRAYNVSGTGLNQYILLLANTGTGKEACASGIDKLINKVSEQVPVAPEFIGPSEIASGQALVKYLSNKSQSFVSILGEFGLRLQAMSDHRANGAEKSLKRMLLDLYNKSGHGQVARPSIYADIEKNTNLISAPAFSILGESTPETFYSALTEEMIAEGLLPRFMLIEYNGKRPELSTTYINAQPHDILITKLTDLIVNAKTIMANRKVIDVAFSADAKAELDRFDRLADSKINNTEKEVIRQLWNRAHIKLMKIASIIAIGINQHNPMIELSHVEWGKQIVEHDIKALSAKFESGQIGTNSEEIKQVCDMKRMFKEYHVKEWDKIKAYCSDERMYYARYVPYAYLNRRLTNMASFKKDRRGATEAIKKTIQTLIDIEYISPVPRDKLAKYNTTQKTYMITNVSLLDD